MKTLRRLLITGFEPFGGESVNPSWEAVSRLPDRVGDWQLTRLRGPTVFGLAGEKALEAAETLRPDAVLCVGQAGGRAGVTPEAVAVNLREAAIPDNAGSRPVNEPVMAGGPAAYFATVPVREMVRAIREADIPASLSLSAGAFVCNDLLYTLLEHFDGSDTRVGFIHVPFLPEQAKNGQPSLTIEKITLALQRAIEVL